jgi:hypothetical protein
MNKYLIILFLLLPTLAFSQNVVINEVMASNKLTIKDEDGEASDWIELYNKGNSEINLLGYGLSDDASNLHKWKFGNISIVPGEHLIVFASDKDRVSVLKHWETIITQGDRWKYIIGSAAVPSTWIDPSFNDTQWTEGASGFGFGDNDDATNLSSVSPFISLFVRKKINIDDVNKIMRVVLHVDYDDGFVAYINGVEVARANIGSVGTRPAWNALASSREAVMYSGGSPEKFEITLKKDLFVNGENTIAIEVHNASSTSTDLSLIPFLSVGLSEKPVGAKGSPAILGLGNTLTNAHTNFKISASGETILLSLPNGELIDSVGVPESATDISYARIKDGNLSWNFQIPSPGKANTGKEFMGYADAVVTSLQGGFYPAAINLTLNAGESKIFYTIDGSDPDTNSIKYSGPINIQKTTVIKAFSLKPAYLPSPIICQTYFINEKTTLPVISLSSDPYNLFDYNYGIYANGPGWTSANPNFGANFWMDWERPAHIEFYDDNKKLGFSENCAIAIYGAWSRAFPQKSFSIKFKDSYGASKIDYPLFPNFDITSFKSFVLRNSGNDFQYTHIRDAMMQTLVKDLDIDYLEYRPATTFINGEYWGIYNIREKINEHYVAARHGVDPDSIDMLEGNMTVIHGDANHYQELINYISTNDMTTDAAYNYVNKMIDLDECLLYFAAQVYYNSQDWPANNIKYWRERSDKGKWRWILYDLDFGFNLYESNGQSENHLTYLLSGIETRPGSNPTWSTLLPRKLVENPKIKNKFINLIADLLNTNFESNRVVNIIKNMADHISSEISRHRARFSIGGENLDRMNSFAKDRPGYLRGFVRDFFKCGNNVNITINASEGGRVELNSLSFEKSKLPWTGIYFQNNAIQLNAVPKPGYKFDGWSGAFNSKEQSIAVNIAVSASVTANFSVDANSTTNIVINEINYNSHPNYDSEDWIELYNVSKSPIDISDWIVKDESNDNAYLVPNNTIIKGEGYLVFCRDTSEFRKVYGNEIPILGDLGFGLNNSGDQVRIFDQNNYLVDSVAYDDAAPWVLEPDGKGHTLSLVDPFSDNSLPSSWKASLSIGTPCKKNDFLVTSIENDARPLEFRLAQNYPNPFNASTIISFSLASSGVVSVEIYNALGELIRTVVNEYLASGSYSFTVDLSNESSGVYLCRMLANNKSFVKKMISIK